MTCRLRVRPGLATAVLVAAPWAHAGPPKLTVERLQADPPLAGSLPSHLSWHPDGKRLSFLRGAPDFPSLYALELAKGEQALLLDGAKVLAPGDKPRRLSLAGSSWLPDGRRLLVPAEGAPILDAEPLRSLPRPYRLGLTPSPVGTADPFLYHKTDLREVYRRALEGCPGCDDALLRNERGELTESCIANLVVELDGELVTPPVRSGLLPGIGRSLLLAQGRVRERVLRAEDLARCSRVLLVNAVRGMWAAELRGN